MIDVIEHLQGYRVMINDALSKIDTEKVALVTKELLSAMQAGLPIYVCGNGGSAAISQHFACDHAKGVHTDCKKDFQWGPNVVSLSTNVPMITAIANDMDYASIFSEQLKYVKNEGVLVAISSSGNSPNIVKAIVEANAKKMVTIAFTGFDGGLAHQIANIGINVPINNYGVVEDVHQMLMHVMSQTFRINQTNKDLETLKL